MQEWLKLIFLNKPKNNTKLIYKMGFVLFLLIKF